MLVLLEPANHRRSGHRLRGTHDASSSFATTRAAAAAAIGRGHVERLLQPAILLVVIYLPVQLGVALRDGALPGRRLLVRDVGLAIWRHVRRPLIHLRQRLLIRCRYIGHRLCELQCRSADLGELLFFGQLDVV